MYVKIIAIAVLVIVIGWKFWDYNRIIGKQEKEIVALKEDKVRLRTDIQTEKNNVIILKQTIEHTNKEIVKLEAKYEKTKKEYNDFLNKPKEDKYQNIDWLNLVTNNKWNSSICEDGLRLNRILSEMKYENL